jgi:parvulin-like peptidyl-prolyl isomerase
MKQLMFIAAAAAALMLAACGTDTATVKGGIGGADSILSSSGGQEGGTGKEEGKTGGQGAGEEETPLLQKEAAKLDRNTVAIIGKYVITKEKYKIITDYMRQKYDYKLTADQEKEFIDFIINKKLMAMEARAMGYADREDIKVKYEWDFDDIISHIYYQENIERKTGVGSGAASDYYNANKGDFTEIKAQHILVKSRDMAKNLYKRAIAGENFDELAKKYSEDETTKASGGNLGFFSKGVMVKEFEDAAFGLSRDEVSEPVRTTYGWHIIKVIDKRQISFDESKDKIMNMIKDKKAKDVFDKTIGDLKKKYKVQVNEDIIK